MVKVPKYERRNNISWRGLEKTLSTYKLKMIGGKICTRDILFILKKGHPSTYYFSAKHMQSLMSIHNDSQVFPVSFHILLNIDV